MEKKPSLLNLFFALLVAGSLLSCKNQNRNPSVTTQEHTTNVQDSTDLPATDTDNRTAGDTLEGQGTSPAGPDNK